MSQPRYLTKSRFKLAMECPTKLFYTGKPEYANRKLDDPFLRALADGGFQVGKLAQCYFPEGIEVASRDYDESVNETSELLTRDNATIFEGAFRYKNLFIRADVVKKRGNALELIEVKAKSCDFETEDDCWDKRKGIYFGQIKSDWYPYLADVAFQKYVVTHAYPEFEVTAHLMLADKRAACPTEGLNQKFRLVTLNGRRGVEVSPELEASDLNPWILKQISVEQSCSKLYANDLEAQVEMFADCYEGDRRIPPVPSSTCKGCEFRCDDGSLKSGFHECWSSTFGWMPTDFDEHTILDLWNFKRRDELIGNGKLKLSEITVDEIAPKGKPKEAEAGMNLFARQCLQLEVSAAKNIEYRLDRAGLAAEFSQWKFPLHMIDFETCRPAIPFRAGRRPYENIAFQFSHHVIHEDGRVEHRGEFLQTTRGRFPSYDLVRELMRQLGDDDGSVFRYHNHENSVLCETRDQLLNDAVEDCAELVAFIESITQPRKDRAGDTWTAGPRNMIDLCKMVERYYYHHATRGSISLKYILPAMLGASEFLQKKYSQPIYGSADGIPSLNFTDQRWIVFDDGIVNPYELLGPILPDESEHDNDVLASAWYDEEIRDGGAAMTAYCKLQFTDVPPELRLATEAALKRYCELDTLAMVMIYEAWKAELRL